MAKDAKGHGSEKRGGLPRGTTPEYAGRDGMGRTFTAALRDHDRFPKQNPTMPNAEDYRTAQTRRAEGAAAGMSADALVANALADGNPKAGAVPVHPAHAGMSALVGTVKKAFDRPSNFYDSKGRPLYKKGSVL